MEPVPTLKIMIKIAVGITAITEKLLPGLEKKECISQLRDVLGSIDMSLEDFELLILMKIRSNKEFHGNKLETRAHTKERFDEYIITISRITAYVIIATSGQESPTRSHIIATLAFRQNNGCHSVKQSDTEDENRERLPDNKRFLHVYNHPGIRIRMRR
ncbi:unnamed protein product [Rhizophagus irregularis]|nr:unnamed protein product [Rhizophagus irregularis]